jgi:triphosphoribosyl-dephospho-CoA synthase
MTEAGLFCTPEFGRSSAQPEYSLPYDDFHWLDQFCLEALYLEAIAWPKPGLVTPIDSGSHNDMDINTFFASIASLKGYFSRVAQGAASGCTLAGLQAIGIAAEQSMLLATGGANTHRGAIFNLGFLAAAAALRREDLSLSGLQCGEIVKRLWGRALSKSRMTVASSSHGTEVYRLFTAGGARSEASAGFPSVYCVGLPFLRGLLKEQVPIDSALIGTLLVLMEHVDDTNLLWRGGEEGLAFVQRSAREFNADGGIGQPFWCDKLVIMHQEFVSRNLSPGGSADLLAATWVAHHLET